MYPVYLPQDAAMLFAVNVSREKLGATWGRPPHNLPSHELAQRADYAYLFDRKDPATTVSFCLLGYKLRSLPASRAPALALLWCVLS